MKTTNDQISKEGLLSEELMKEILETKDESLDLSNCENLKVLPKLSTQIKKLSLLNCSRLESVENLAEMTKITSLDLTNCKNLISPILPEGITHLILAGCENLKVLPKLPKGLTRLSLSGCKNLKVLPELPEALTSLDLSGCYNLEALPKLPEALIFLDLSGCSKIEYKEETINRIKKLEEKGCIVTYPEQFDPDFRKTSENLEKAIKSYQEIPSYQEMPKPTFVRELLWHYLTREVPHRGGLADLIESTKPFLELVSKEPKNLEWADQIASLYLEGCVNQPVIGWSEISACVSIAEAPTTIEKIEASKHLATTILIKSFICDLKENQKPAQDYEAEFANALLREVYKKLHDEKKIDTKKPWYAMPENIVYEHYIENFLTAKLVDKACKKINEHIFSNEKLANILINNYSENWGQIAFPQELKQIKDKYDERMIKGEKVDKKRQEEIDNTISKLTLQALTSEVSPRSTFGKRPGEGGYEKCDPKRARG